jgi:methyl-accepting chemotaxis protein
MPQSNHRRDKLVRPRLQLRLILVFLGVALFALLFQFALFAAVLSNLATDLPQDGAILLEESTGVAITILVVSLSVLLPLSFFVGVLATFRIAGPIYRFERHLEAVAAGEDPGPCKIRTGDELHELCDKLNKALERMRQAGAFRRQPERVPELEEAA